MVWLDRLERQVLAGFGICVVAMAVLHEVTQLKDVAGTIQTQIVEDHYSMLGIAAEATQAEIMTAFKRATNKLTSKQQADAAQGSRAKLNAAYNVLSNPATRRAYDERRSVVRLVSMTFIGFSVCLPLLFGMMWAKSVCFRADLLDPDSFLGQVVFSLQHSEAVLEVEVHKDHETRSLGAQLAAVRNESMLQICSLSNDGAIHSHNQKVLDDDSGRSSVASPEMCWWHLPVLRESDILESVNGQSGAAMMGALRSLELKLQLRRPLVGGASVLPWLGEIRLSRSSGSERWGLNLTNAKDSSDSLQVRDIPSVGVAARWNEENPDHAFQPGDRVVAADQCVGADAMLQLCADETRTSVCFLIARGVLLPPGAIQSSPPQVLCRLSKREGEKLGIRVGRCLESPGKGILLEPDCMSRTIVKEVVQDHLVDRWNRQTETPLLPGCVVMAVNGEWRPEQFARELSKRSVKILFRPPTRRLAPAEVTAAPRSDAGRPRRIPVRIDQEELRPWAVRNFGALVPAFLSPKPFEEQLRNSLRKLRCEFIVKVSTESGRLGLQFKHSNELLVLQVAEDGVIAQYNCSPECERVESGDWLVAVNGETHPRRMIEKLTGTELELRFARPAARAAPGVWEVEVGRDQAEGWGLELKEETVTTVSGPRSAGVLRIQRVVAGAIHRWNESEGPQWSLQAGDLLLACEPEISPKRMLQRLRDSQKVRLSVLRWHAGPAPEPEASPVEPQRTHFEVTLRRALASERLGLRLVPSARDPTRTVVSEVVPGSLADRHNQAAIGSERIVPGDEVDSVNGDGDPSRFAEICKQQMITFRFTRRSRQLPSQGRGVPEPAEKTQAKGARAVAAVEAEAEPEPGGARPVPRSSEPATSPSSETFSKSRIVEDGAKSAQSRINPKPELATPSAEDACREARGALLCEDRGAVFQAVTRS
ncbi:unnamed protein product [Effrenium voratum]|uniref:J domain-containing protein n=1 Tax=Effrenium voratum TaxID=2562239 RepID=A0AA36IRL0_9DINO|nr:unnamed protein product [Effrenium voratum]